MRSEILLFGDWAFLWGDRQNMGLNSPVWLQNKLYLFYSLI